ncbi:MAG: pyridoxal phosphate-dependent class II aminotransferase [Acidobacteria bacterium]|nr:pyridoxal phosphate-dependent class II aminotransferase [Acidobacteriota bacterium]
MHQTYPIHGGQLHHIAQRFNLPPETLTDFSANINPSGPPSAVLAALHAALDHPSVLTLYPDLQHTQLKQAIAQHLGLTPQHIIVANGFVPLLDAVLRTLHLRTCLLPVPSFVEYRQSLSRAGIAITPHPCSADSNFSYDAGSILAARHDAILLANPQNPSGILHSATFMRDLIRIAAQSNTHILLDEAFIDYAPEDSLTHAIDQLPNLIVFRSVTKFHAIPGLRVAYAVASPQLASAINAALPPWPITTLASVAVIAALTDDPYAITSRSENIQRRDDLRAQLTALGLTVYPSAANFLFFRIPTAMDPDAFWQHMITAHRIVLRSCANYEALPPCHFRTAVLTPQKNTQLVTAIAASLSHLL